MFGSTPPHPDQDSGLRLEDVACTSVLGYPVARVDLEQATALARDLIVRCRRDGRDRQLVTLNPEFIVQAEADPALRSALLGADLRVADGVGVVWAARRAGARLPGRVPGVELATALMAAEGANLRVFFFGAKPGIAEEAAREAHERFGITVAGSHHGYAREPAEIARVVERIRASHADLLLAGLGPRQETFLAAHRGALGGLLGIGVGGTLDVLAGHVRRTPSWTRRLGLEWAWRVGLDPSRWHRAPRLARFVWMVLRQG